MPVPIYYLYNKATGEFMGSGTVFIDTEAIGSSELIPEEPTTESVKVFENGAWVLKTKDKKTGVISK